IVSIHSCNHLKLDFLWTYSFTFADIGAASEKLFFDLRHHLQCTLVPFRLPLRKQTKVADLRSGEKRCGRVRASGDTGAASDACSGIHCKVGIGFGYQNCVGVAGTACGNRDKAAARYYSIEGGTVDDKVFDNRERFRAPRLEIKDVALLEMPQV